MRMPHHTSFIHNLIHNLTNGQYYRGMHAHYSGIPYPRSDINIPFKLVHQGMELTDICTYRIASNNNSIFPRSEQSAEAALSVYNRMRLIVVCCWVVFAGSVALGGSATIPTWWGIACVETPFVNPLQAWTPSAHVCSNCKSPASPQFWNQAAPRTQQLLLSDLFIVAQLGQLVPTLTPVRLVSVSDPASAAYGSSPGALVASTTLTVLVTYAHV